MRLTRAVTHLRLTDANHAKIAALDALATTYMALCQQYTTYFCTEANPDKYADPCFVSPLSQRWQRVAIQQAAGIAQSWGSNRSTAYQEYLEVLADYHVLQEQQPGNREESTASAPHASPPEWREWHLPVLKETLIQANANVALLEPATNAKDTHENEFDYWLRFSTLEYRQPVFLPIKLADYHRQALTGKTLASSTALTRKSDGWWLTLFTEETISVITPQDAPVIGVDVGISNFLTTSTGEQYGTFNGKLARKHQRDREKRRRKAKLRACLKQKGVPDDQLPSTRNEKLARTVRQDINRAINQFFSAHPETQIAYEQLHVAGMKFKARRMNAYLYAANLAHLPKQLAWGAAKRGIRSRAVKSAYSSQECSRCHHVARANRPEQQTFCCGVCGYTTHADGNAAQNLASRWSDTELAVCANKEAIKTLLAQRHQYWKAVNGFP